MNGKSSSSDQLDASRLYLDQHLMIIAAPGSGKTFTMMKRILTLLNKGVKPCQIMATTFTKKAANELLIRIQKELPKNYLLTGMRFGTIHSCALKILRAHGNKMGIGWKFDVISPAEQIRVLESSLKDFQNYFELDSLLLSCIRPVSEENLWGMIETRYSLSVPLSEKDFSYISSVICSAKVESEFEESLTNEFRWLFERYNQRLKEIKCIDFSDILYLSVKLLKKFPKVTERYQKEIKFLLVDEFQDTNLKQFEFLMLVAGKACITVCGDDDQAIYSWRGAQSNMFEKFKNLFPNIPTIFLHTNYRSTPEILEISMNLISKNKNRTYKQIHPHTSESAFKPEILINGSTRTEVLSICRLIKYYKDKGYQNDQIAVLYRLSKTVEDLLPELNSQHIPVKSIQKPVQLTSEEQFMLTYVKLALNLEDQDAFITVCNFPLRKFGDTAKSKLHYIATHKNCSLFGALTHVISSQKNPLKCFSDFHSLMSDLTRLLTIQTVSEFISGLALRLKLQKSNTLSLLTEGFSSGRSEFEAFLARAEGEDRSNKICLSTIHSAKGQEWEVVILVRLNEGVLPSNEDIEEERRLAYVAATRAKSHLILSCVHSPNSSPVLIPSRFLHEFFPPDVKRVQSSVNISKPSNIIKL
jgi:superfamily I DNA/RNA helicase